MIDFRKLTTIRILNASVECSACVAIKAGGNDATNPFFQAILFLQDGELCCLHGSGETQKKIVELPKEKLFSKEKFTIIKSAGKVGANGYDSAFSLQLQTQLGSNYNIEIKATICPGNFIKPLAFESLGYERTPYSQPKPPTTNINTDFHYFNSSNNIESIRISASGGRAETYNKAQDRINKVINGELTAIKSYFSNKDNINLSTWGGLGSAQHTRVNDKGETETYFVEPTTSSGKNTIIDNMKKVVGLDRSAFLTAFGANGTMPSNLATIEIPSVSGVGNGDLKLTFSDDEKPLNFISFSKTGYDEVFNKLYSSGERVAYIPQSISLTKQSDTEYILENTAYAYFNNGVSIIIRGGEKKDNG